MQQKLCFKAKIWVDKLHFMQRKKEKRRELTNVAVLIENRAATKQNRCGKG